MTLKICSCCKTLQTTKNIKPKGRSDFGIYFDCRTCGSTLLLRAKNWKALIEKQVREAS